MRCVACGRYSKRLWCNRDCLYRAQLQEAEIIAERSHAMQLHLQRMIDAFMAAPAPLFDVLLDVEACSADAILAARLREGPAYVAPFIPSRVVSIPLIKIW